jgi:hypothetical protein
VLPVVILVIQNNDTPLSPTVLSVAVRRKLEKSKVYPVQLRAPRGYSGSPKITIPILRNNPEFLKKWKDTDAILAAELERILPDTSIGISRKLN